MRLYGIGIALVLSTLLFTSSSFAAPNQTHDTSRRLYDRIMTEFKHREYEAALAGFRLFMELHSQSALAANPPWQPMPSIGSENANTAWGAIRMRSTRSITSS